MKLIPNIGQDRVIDELRQCLAEDSRLDVATSAFSLFAFGEMRELLEKLAACRLVLPGHTDADLNLLGTAADRSFRNRLVVPWLASKCRDWISRRVDVLP